MALKHGEAVRDRHHQGFERFIARRRAEAAYQRQLRTSAIPVACLAAACTVLAAANVILVFRPGSRVAPETVASATGSVAGGTSAPLASGDGEGTPRAGEKGRGASAPLAARRGGEAPAPPPAGRAADADSSDEPASRGGSVAMPEEARGLPERPSLEPGAAAGDPARRTATWLVQAYGREAAAERARAAAAFFEPNEPDGVYWRRVLGHIRRAGTR